MIINKVTLYSHALNDMRNFYVNELGFELLSHTDDGFEIKAGDSVLEIKKYHLQEKPFYHFAMNIPTNLFTSAKAWAKSKVELTREDEVDEVYFSYSNAHAFYFSDPSGNIVEFISRYSVSPKSEAESFSAQNVLCISEINITTNEVRTLGNQLVSFGVPVRKAETISENGLNFMGEHEAGSFLLLGPSKRRWIFSDRESEIFPLSIVVNQQFEISLDGEGLMELKKWNDQGERLICPEFDERGELIEEFHFFDNGYYKFNYPIRIKIFISFVFRKGRKVMLID